MKIKHKLGIFFTFLLLISTCVIVALSWSGENFKKNALDSVKSAVQLSAQQLSAELAIEDRTLDIYIHSQEIQSRDPEVFLPYLQGEINRLKPRYEKFIYGLPDGSFYNTAGGNASQGMLRSFDDRNPQAPLHSIRKRDYWLATIGDNTQAQELSFVSQPMISYTTGVRQVVIAKAIVSEGSVIGLLASSLSWESIESYILQLRDNYFSHFDWPPRVILTDREGNYWYHWNPEKIVQKMTDENGQAVIASTGQTMSLISNIKDENIAKLTQLYSGSIPQGANVLLFNTQHGDKDFYFIYQSISQSGYVFGVMVSHDELLGPLTQLRKKYIWLIFFVLFMSFLAILFMARSLSSPIEKLTQAVEALSNGETLPITTVSGSKEVKLLSLAFEKMRSRLLQRETALAASESRLNYAMQGANDGLWDWNLDNDEVFYSPRWITMLGYDPNDFEYNLSSLLQLLHPGDHVKWELALESYLSGKQEKFHLIIRFKHRDGHYLYVLSRAFAVKSNAADEALRLVGTHVDISEQIAFEEKIKALNNDLERRVANRTQDLMLAKEAALSAQTEAERASHAKSRFLANMSHELRTPLNSINGFADRLVIRLEGKIESRHMDALKTIARNGRQLLNIINDILDTQRIDSGEVTLKYSLVLIPELLDQLARVFEDRTESKGLAFHINYPSNTDYHSIYADPLRIRQILENLLSNAVKFTDQGSISLSATAAKHNLQDGIRFDVQDTGRGIETSLIDELFSPFTQADDSVSRPIAGTGLGLTLVKLLTEMHNGVVTVASTFGEGSTFSVWIPNKKP